LGEIVNLFILEAAMEKERMEEFRTRIKHHLSNGNQVGTFVADVIGKELAITTTTVIDCGIDGLINAVAEEIAAVSSGAQKQAIALFVECLPLIPAQNHFGDIMICSCIMCSIQRFIEAQRH
jgi:hypothetical protein